MSGQSEELPAPAAPPGRGRVPCGRLRRLRRRRPGPGTRGPSVNNRPSWPVLLSPPPAGTVGELPDHAREMLRDVLDIAGRDPWFFPPFRPPRPRRRGSPLSAAVGHLTAVYWINRPAGRLYVLDIIWLG